MKITTVFCDICQKECDSQRFGVVSGCILKMNEKGQMGNMIFEGHYCEEDISKIIQYIEKLNHESRATDSTVEHIGEGDTGDK